MANWITNLSGIRPEEGRRTLLATLFYMFFVAQVVMTKSAANALFLSRHNPKNLPVLYILVAILVAASVVVAARTLADPRRRMLRLLSLATAAVVLVISWALLRLGLPISPFLYLFGELSATALNIQFWSVAGDIFDPQEGKRVFGILAGGGMSGSIVGGLFVHHAGLLIGTVNLLLTGAISLLVCMACAHALAKHQGRADALPSRHVPSLKTGLRYVGTDPYPRTFAVLMLVGMVLTAFVDYFFRTSAQTFLTEDRLAALFGDLNFYIGVISAVFLLGFSNRILRRLGIFYYLLIVPTGLVGATIASIFFPQFTAIYALKIIESTGSLSINQAGLQLLYNPMPTVLRAPARGTIDGMARKMGYAVGGALLLLLVPILEPPAWQLIIMVLVMAYALLLLRLRTLYVHTLDERLRVGAKGPVSLRLEDANTHRVLLAGLESGGEELVLNALTLLTEIPSIDLRQELRRLLEHESERVRILAIDTIAKRGYKEFLFELLDKINYGSRRIRVAAVRAVVNLDPQRAGAALAPYLRSDGPGLVTAAIEALIQLRGYHADNPAIPVLERLLEEGQSSSPGHRREVAKLLGRLGDNRYSPRLVTYLNDPDPSVRRLAITSCQGAYRPDFVPYILNMLSDRETHREARETLATYGNRVVDQLENWLNDRNRPIGVRMRIPRVLRTIATRRAGEVLLYSNISDDAFLRTRIALALSGIRLQNPHIEFDRKWALEAVDRRLESYTHYSGLYEKLARAVPAHCLSLQLLKDRLNQNLEVIFRVLGLIYPHRMIMSIHHRFQSSISEVRADALDLLDNILDRESRDRLLPILEIHHRLLDIMPASNAPEARQLIQDELTQLSSSRDLLLRSTVIHTRCMLGENCADQYPVLFEGKSTMEVMDKVLFLESVDIFRQNNLDDLTALAAIAREKRYKAGEAILVEGEPGDALYIITSGQVEIVKGHRSLLALSEKSSLGGVSLLDQKPHAASALCTTDCDVLVIDRTDFMDLVSDRVELLHGIFLALTDRLRALLAVTEGGGLAEDRYDDGPTNPV